MKVLHVLWSGHIGGIERVVYDLARAQRRAGLEVGLLMGQAQGVFFDKALAAGIPVIGLGLRSGFDFHPQAILLAHRAIAQADVIHFHGFLPQVVIASFWSRRPSVYSDHGHDITSKQTFQKKVKNWIRVAFVQYVSKVAANSDYTRQLASRIYQLPLKEIAVVHNGIDEETIRPEFTKANIRKQFNIPQDCAVVGTVCRLATFKRVDRLLESFSLLPPRAQGVLLIVGDGPALSALQLQADGLGITEKVVFTGFRADIGNMLHAMDIFVLPSQGEPFGIAVLEALVAGLPVLAFADVGGAAEIIGNPTIFTPLDMATALLHQIESPTLTPKPIEYFRIGRMVTQFSEIYQEILHEPYRITH